MLDSGLVNLFFYTPREPNNYIKGASPFFSSFNVVPTDPIFWHYHKKRGKGKEKETTRVNFFYLN